MNGQAKVVGSDVLGTFPYLKPCGAGTDVFMPTAFRNAVLLHVSKNFVPHLDPPLLLGIQGPMGEGKTFQTKAACSALGFYVVPLSGAQLSGSYEGGAVQVLEQAYVFASKLCRTVGEMTVLLIDDFDLSVAAVLENREYTVNSQLLAGFIMNLCDEPTRCGDTQTLRIPIIATGNNLSSIFAPLTRHGRMDCFDYQPGRDEKLAIVSSILCPLLAPDQESRSFRNFFYRYEHEPVAFFAALKQDVVDAAILECFERLGAVKASQVQMAASGAVGGQTIARLSALAEQRHSSKPSNFLGRGR